MSVVEFLVTVLMMSSVVRQLRGRRLTWWGLAWPVALVAWAGFSYLQSIPASGHNVLLVAALGVVGAGLGLICGRLSRVYRQPAADDASGQTRTAVMVRSTGTAAVLWIVGIGSRLAFGLYAEHGGAEVIARLSDSWQVTSPASWSTGLVLMSLLEVGGRTTQLAPRLLATQRRWPRR